MNPQITVDREFMRILPDLVTESRKQLEESLAMEGCREPLTVWRHGGQDILLDGHNRLEICQSRGIEYQVRVMTTEDIPDRNAALEWIIRNQLARRNLPEDVFAFYLGRLYNAQKKDAAENLIPGAKSSKGHNGTSRNLHKNAVSVTTAERLAKEHGVSARTVKRAGRFAQAIEKMKERDPGIEAKVLKGEVTRQQVLAQAKPAKSADSRIDPDGRAIPPHLIHTFDVAEQIKHLARDVTRVRTAIEQAAEAEPAAWSQIGLQDVTAKLKLVAEHLRLGAPYVVCVYCGGSDSESCRACRGAGILSKAQVRCAPSELRTGKAKEDGE